MTAPVLLILPLKSMVRYTGLNRLRASVKMDIIRCVAIAPGYVGTAMVKEMNQKALDYIKGQVPIGRLIEPEEVAGFVGDIYRNEAVAGDVYYIHGGLRLGSKG